MVDIRLVFNKTIRINFEIFFKSATNKITYTLFFFLIKIIKKLEQRVNREIELKTK